MGTVAAGQLPDALDALLAALGDDVGGAELAAQVGALPFEVVQRCEQLRHVDTVQLHFSLLYRDDYRELQPFCQENGIAILAYGPLGFGVLTRTMATDTRFPDNDWRSGGVPVPVPLSEQIFAPGTFERHLTAVDALRPVAERDGMTLAPLALAWTVAQPGVTAAIVGSRSAARMRAKTPRQADRTHPRSARGDRPTTRPRRFQLTILMQGRVGSGRVGPDR